ncbi:MAG: thiopeptide-type bacteriocin biosynthesis protein, partial [Anaerolineales bacterium]|nr:thiopeptide-type bacteriocin biosynthesis protein [Anaerolineales bacterium]
IRYWERGPHIRLRLKGQPSALQNHVKPALEATFTDYFTKYPSERPSPETSPPVPAEQTWLPNNSVQFIAYEPEIDRYGGPTGIEIAEKHFQSSSRAVLAALTTDEWAYEKALATAIQMHLSFAHAFGFSLTETAAFFTYFSDAWFPAAVHATQGLEQSEEALKQRLQKAFSDAFDKQATTLLSLHESLWLGLTAGATFSTSWFNHWLPEVQDVAKRLTTANKKDALTVPSRTEKQEQLLWPILISYVHMTNNRLGILNLDEAFLGYILSRCTRQLSGTG